MTVLFISDICEDPAFATWQFDPCCRVGYHDDVGSFNQERGIVLDEDWDNDNGPFDNSGMPASPVGVNLEVQPPDLTE
jgi:hypothetical protein